MVTAALAERIALIRAALGPDPFDELFAAGGAQPAGRGDRRSAAPRWGRPGVM